MEYIQSKVELIHRIEASKPTQDTAPTKAGTNDETQNNADRKNPRTSGTQEEKVAHGLMRKSSIWRRVGNTTLNTVSNYFNLEFNKKIFREQFIGNNRGAYKISQQKASFGQVANTAKQTASTAVTASVLWGSGGGYILAFYALQKTLDIANNHLQVQQQTYEFNANKEKELFSSFYQRNRLNVNTYNRRR